MADITRTAMVRWTACLTSGDVVMGRSRQVLACVSTSSISCHGLGGRDSSYPSDTSRPITQIPADQRGLPATRLPVSGHQARLSQSARPVDGSDRLLPIPVEEDGAKDHQCDTGACNTHRNRESGPVPRQLIAGVELGVVRQSPPA